MAGRLRAKGFWRSFTEQAFAWRARIAVPKSSKDRAIGGL